AESAMDSQTWRRVRALFEQALELAPGERALFLDRACPEPKLRAEIEQMLTADESPRSVSDWISPIVPPAPEPTVRPEGVAREISNQSAGIQPCSSPYRVEEEIGRGGMGIVFRVWDDTLRRPLAMKVMRGQDLLGDAVANAPSEVTARRFVHEAQIT